MKKKNLFGLMAALVIAVAGLGMASCSSDSDSGIDSPLKGTWESTVNTGEKFIFNGNGTCIKQYIAPATKAVSDIVVDNSLLEQYFYGIWEADGTKLSVTWNSTKTVKQEGDQKVTNTETYTTPKTETGTFSISGDAVLIQLGDGVSYTTWRGTRSK